jgi:hypothetical protein
LAFKQLLSDDAEVAGSWSTSGEHRQSASCCFGGGVLVLICLQGLQAISIPLHNLGIDIRDIKKYEKYFFRQKINKHNIIVWNTLNNPDIVLK